jgi:DNA-binding NtrC family response regulator
LEVLCAQNWPGNVRELENIIRKMLLIAQGYTINADHVAAALNRSRPQTGSADQTLGEFVNDLIAAAQRGEFDDAHARLLQTAEKALFTRAIELAQGNQAKAARWLGVSRLTMREKLIQFGSHPAQDQTGLEK